CCPLGWPWLHSKACRRRSLSARRLISEPSRACWSPPGKAAWRYVSELRGRPGRQSGPLILYRSRCTVAGRGHAAPRPLQNIVKFVIRPSGPVPDRCRPLAYAGRELFVDRRQGDLDAQSFPNEFGDVALCYKLRHVVLLSQAT